jgi:hypothetical protein
MEASKNLVSGFAVAVLVGLVGGGALNGIAAKMAPHADAPAGSADREGAHAKVESVSGAARILTGDGQWRPLRAGEDLPGWTAVTTQLPEAEVAISYGDARITLSEVAHLMLKLSPAPARLDLTRGRAIVRSASRTEVSVPKKNVEVSGTGYGVWAREDGALIVAGLEGDTEVKAGGRAIKIEAGHQALVGKDGSKSLPIPAQLSIEAEHATKAHDHLELSGTTDPYALLIWRKGNAIEPVAVGPDGSFTVPLKKEAPAPGELVAYDAAGRRAEIGHPSQATGAAGAAKLGSTKADKPPLEAKKVDRAPEPPKPAKPEKVEPPKHEDKRHAAKVAPEPPAGKKAKPQESGYEMPVAGTDGAGTGEAADEAKKAEEPAKKADDKKKKGKKDKTNEDEIELNWDE